MLIYQTSSSEKTDFRISFFFRSISAPSQKSKHAARSKLVREIATFCREHLVANERRFGLYQTRTEKNSHNLLNFEVTDLVFLVEKLSNKPVTFN